MEINRLRSTQWFMIVALGFAVFTEQWLYCAVSPVFPTALTARFHIKEDEVQGWVDTLFAIEAAGLLFASPVVGYFSDKVVKRKAFLVLGTVVLLAAHAVQAFVKHIGALIVGRLLQGGCAAVVWGVGLALVADRTPSNRTGEIMGYVSAPFNAAAVAGPVLGGIIYDRAGYVCLFAVGFAFIGIQFALLLLLAEHDQKKTTPLIPDPATFVAESCVAVPEPAMRSASISTVKTEDIFSTTFSSETKSVYSANESKLTEQSIWGEYASFQESTTSTLWERIAASTLVAFAKSWQLWATFLANVVVAMILPGFDVTLPIFAEQTFGWNSLGAGLLFLALAVPGLFQPLLGKITDRFGPRWSVTGGLALCIIPYACLMFIDRNSTAHVVVLCVLLAIIGLGASLSLAATMADFCAIAKSIEDKRPGSLGKSGAYAQAYVFFNVSWAIGELIGSNVAGLMRHGTGWGVMGWSYMGICGVGAIIAVLFCDGWIGSAKQQHRRRRMQRSSGQQLA